MLTFFAFVLCLIQFCLLVTFFAVSKRPGYDFFPHYIVLLKRLIFGLKCDDKPIFAIELNVTIALVMVIELKPRSVDYHLRSNMKPFGVVDLSDDTVEFFEVIVEIKRYDHCIELMGHDKEF